MYFRTFRMNTIIRSTSNGCYVIYRDLRQIFTPSSRVAVVVGVCKREREREREMHTRHITGIRHWDIHRDPFLSCILFHPKISSSNPLSLQFHEKSTILSCTSSLSPQRISFRSERVSSRCIGVEVNHPSNHLLPFPFFFFFPLACDLVELLLCCCFTAVRSKAASTLPAPWDPFTTSRSFPLRFFL